MRTFSNVFFFAAAIAVGGCQASVGDDDSGDDQPHELPPLTPTPEGYVSRPSDAAVELPEGTTIDIEQLYAVGSDGAPPELMGGQDPHIRVTLRTDNPSAFPAAPDAGIAGLNLYVNGCPIELESASPIEAPTSWRWFVERGDVPIQVLRSHFMVWEIRGYRYAEVDEPDAGADADTDADTDADSDGDTDSDTGTGGPVGPMQEIRVVYRAIDQLPPGEFDGAGFPNFLTPAEGETLLAGDSLTVTWEPLGLLEFTGSQTDLGMQGWIQGGALDLRPDPDNAINVDEAHGELTFNVGSFQDWDWINMSVTIPLEHHTMRVVGALSVN